MTDAALAAQPRRLAVVEDEPMNDLDDLWITVRNWDKFQHYTDRNPPWIRLYTDLADNDAIQDLPLSAIGLLSLTWCTYARCNTALKVGFLRHKVASYGRARDFYAHLTSLNHAGLITLSASKPLAPERKKERKSGANAENPKPRKPKPPAETRVNAAAYTAGAARPDDPVHVDEHMLELAKGWLQKP